MKLSMKLYLVCAVIISGMISQAVFAGEAAGKETIWLDRFEEGSLRGWGIWQSKKPYTFKRSLTDQAKEGKGALLCDMRVGSGVITYAKGKPWGIEAGKDDTLSFWLKAADGNAAKAITLVLKENDGEIYYSKARITSEWTRVEIPFSRFGLRSYGGGKVVNGKLEVDKIVTFQFNNYDKDTRAAVFIVDDIAVNTAAKPKPAEDESGQSTVMVDRFEGARLAGWGIWQSKKPYTFKIAIAKDAKAGKGSLLCSMQGGSGIIQKGLAGCVPASMTDASLVLSIKAGEGNVAKKITIILRESDGEIYHCVVPISREWKTHTIALSKFRIRTWGGGKVLNRKLDIDKLANIQFSNYGKDSQNAVFLVDELGFQGKLPQEKHPAQSTPKEQAPLKRTKAGVVHDPARGVFNGKTFVPVSLEDGPRRSRGEYPASCSNVTIKGSSFFRDDRPTFLIGGWQLDNECHPWLLRLLSKDLYVQNAHLIYHQYEPRSKDGVLHFAKSPTPYYEAWIHRALQNGLLYWHEHKSHWKWGPHKKHIPEAANAGHFFAMDPFHPLGRQFYRTMYRAWMRYTRKYPIFVYELFNEVEYFNEHERARTRFRSVMKEKYRDIALANSAWGTKFASFDKVQVPGFMLTDSNVNAKARGMLRQVQARQFPNLWSDWIKFQEFEFDQAMQQLMPEMRMNDPRPETYDTIQSHCSLFLDYANAGASPQAIAKTGDFYTHEMAATIFPQEDRESVDQITIMQRLNMTCDIVRNITPHKPIFNGESPLGVAGVAASVDEMVREDKASLHSKWKFFDSTNRPGGPEGWHEKAFDDSAWGTIKVPAMWGKEGHPNCKDGIYRKKFVLPVMEKGKRYFINASMLCDGAWIHLNGKLLHRTKTWSESVTLDVTDYLQKENVLAIRIVNGYFSDGMYFGGIRGHIALNTYSMSKPVMLKPSYYRLHNWTQVAHGMSGNMVCYTGTSFQDAAKVLPRVKKEIESVADIVLPRPRTKGRIALVYPFETFRGIVHENYKERIQAQATRDYLKTYSAALFSNVGLDVITNRDIVEGRADSYRMILMAGNIRVPTGTYEALQKYLKRGGVLYADVNSLSINDDTHKPMDTGTLLGVRFGKLLKTAKTLSAVSMGIQDMQLRRRKVDGAYALALEPAGAETIGDYDTPAPAITKFKIGKGVAFTSGAMLSFDAMRSILSSVIRDCNIDADLCVVGDARYVEAHLFGKEDSKVLLATNWGMERSFRIALPNIPAGQYRLRNVQNGRTLRSLQGQDLWSESELKGGIPFKLECADPAVLLIEKSTVKPRVIRSISPKRYAMLQELWRSPKTIPGAPTVAVTPEFYLLSVRPLKKSYHPTAERILEECGFNVVRYRPGMDLSKIDALIWTSPSTPQPKDEVQRIVEFVNNGGGLLLTSQGSANYHHTVRNKALYQRFGIEPQQFFKYLSTDKIAEGEDLLNVHCRDFADHPIAADVSDFTTGFAGVMNVGKAGKVILRAPKDSSIPGAAVVVEVQSGKGKVLAISDSWWLKPLNFNKADNPQLWVNSVRYITGQNIQPLTDEQKKRGLFISAEALAEAETQENAGKYEFAPLELRLEALEKWKKSPAFEDPITEGL